jgi:ABC-type antimicrobial peptide transport system permease subunit
MGSLFSLDEEAMGNAFSVDESAMSGLDFSGILDPNAVMAAMPPMDMTGALAGIGDGGTTPDMQSALQGTLATAIGGLMNGYMTWYMPSGLPPTEIGEHFGEFMQTPEAQTILTEAIANDPSMAAYQAQMTEYQAQMQAAIAGYMQGYMQQMLTIMSEQIAVNMQGAMASLTANMAGAMHIDQDAFAEAFQFNLDEAELTALMLSMMGGQQSSLNGNLTKLGYADFESPYQISLYPFDFEGKQEILNILDAYNKRMEDAGEEEKVITYTDIVGTLMSSVTTIIDMISMVLVAFVAISLVVSSIMIGVITYISVLERKKEIGILRSIGASKGDIGNVFNAETLIVGFVAGAMGIAIVLVLSIPINLIVLQGFDIPNIVLLPPLPALILIGVSCLLTFVAGLMPSSAASRKDPVEALRSE